MTIIFLNILYNYCAIRYVVLSCGEIKTLIIIIKILPKLPILSISPMFTQLLSVPMDDLTNLTKLAKNH